MLIYVRRSITELIFWEQSAVEERLVAVLLTPFSFIIWGGQGCEAKKPSRAFEFLELRFA
jgi:hypothetical protein